MTVIVVSLNDGNWISVNGDSFDEYDGTLYVYDKDERVAIFNKDEWAFGMKTEPSIFPSLLAQSMSQEANDKVMHTTVSKPSDSPYRAPQTWEYLMYIPTHLTLEDDDGMTWQHNGQTWVREDGRKSTDAWTGPYTEVIE
ncbi:hypothetical protein FDI11_gp43 [Mycobacterium phage Tiger]|uniref:Uncharacterized protein n=3 Tax=Benedictvirus TaxID=2946819 RepID=H9NCW3_9CAUD|nr:hypothetical protein X823_gp43 [Mycobacterium phage Conspiracy]YP_008859075.1 hypothetical protein X816_gp41 [Mycobacterium phage Jovo]YP_009607692.1 hypothetical protein FDI11_gp43 [Mycobacterium phage Tiger]YP_010061012.1 hypothetical protein KIP52_gp33 [Mycobacterium phage Archetta]ATW60022.1 hypothetical protein SEA_PHLORENCE_48 [Mycobacterium phage Phlorence]ATW60442.1 hypothetical protein SEA_FORGETIT_50 [Mycobacterium phage ForGetIt]ATW60995.1 hypothetical protein SEA_ARAGOG_49 [Myc